MRFFDTNDILIPCKEAYTGRGSRKRAFRMQGAKLLALLHLTNTYYRVFAIFTHRLQTFVHYYVNYAIYLPVSPTSKLRKFLFLQKSMKGFLHNILSYYVLFVLLFA